MAVGTAVLGFFVKEVGKKAFWGLVNQYFPNTDTFEKGIEESLGQLNRKVDNIAQDAAFIRIQPVKDAYISHINYMKTALIPYLVIESQNTTHNKASLEKYAKEVRKRRIELQANFDQGMIVLNERMNTCDFPLRTLFEILQEIIAIRLVYLSWEYFLYCNIPDADLSEIKLIQENYKKFKAESTTKIKDSIEKICKARLDKTSFSQEFNIRKDKSVLKGQVLVDEWPDRVKYEYRDTFSSTYSTDPFRGEEISHKADLEYKYIWDGLLRTRSKLETAYRDMNKYKIEYEEHRAKVDELNILHVRKPADKFLTALDALPNELQNILV